MEARHKMLRKKDCKSLLKTGETGGIFPACGGDAFFPRIGIKRRAEGAQHLLQIS